MSVSGQRESMLFAASSRQHSLQVVPRSADEPLVSMSRWFFHHRPLRDTSSALSLPDVPSVVEDWEEQTRSRPTSVNPLRFTSSLMHAIGDIRRCKSAQVAQRRETGLLEPLLSRSEGDSARPKEMEQGDDALLLSNSPDQEARLACPR